MSRCSPPYPAAEPLRLHFKRLPGSSTTHCYRTAVAQAPHRPPAAMPFVDICHTGPDTVFSYADSTESWAQITHSAELGVDVLDAPSLGLLQIPLSTYIDDMTSLFPGSGGAFSMRTRYGCQKWFRLGSDGGRVALRVSHPPRNRGHKENALSALTLLSDVTTQETQFQFHASTFLPCDADPNLFAQWPFFFNITAVYHTKDEFALEIVLSNLPPSPLLVREASVNLIHAAVLAAFAINQTIWSHQHR